MDLLEVFLSKRQESIQKLKATFESIFERYDRPFENEEETAIDLRIFSSNAPEKKRKTNIYRDVKCNMRSHLDILIRQVAKEHCYFL